MLHYSFILYICDYFYLTSIWTFCNIFHIHKVFLHYGHCCEFLIEKLERIVFHIHCTEKRDNIKQINYTKSIHFFVITLAYLIWFFSSMNPYVPFKFIWIPKFHVTMLTRVLSFHPMKFLMITQAQIVFKYFSTNRARWRFVW